MSTPYTLSGLPADEVKLARGTPFKTFAPTGKGKAIWTTLQNWIGTLVCGAITIAGIRYFRTKYDFLGWDLFRERNKRAMLWLLVPLGAFLGYLFSLGDGKRVEAEVYEKGFRLRIGKKRFAYEYKDITSLQRSLRSNGPLEESSVNLSLFLTTGDRVNLDVDESDLFLNFSKTLLEAHRDHRQDSVLQSYDKGETLDFGCLEANSTGILVWKKNIARSEISELVPVYKHGSARDLCIKDAEGKTVGSFSRGTMKNDYLFNVILDQEGVKYV